MFTDFIVAGLMFLQSVFGSLFGTVDDTRHDRSDTTTATATGMVVRVIDGDTIDVRIGGGVERVRYIGVDTPEPYRDGEPDCYAEEASARNTALVENKEVTLIADVENSDVYDRLLRYVYVDDVFINQLLIAEGYGDTLMIPPNTHYNQQFTELKQLAQNDRLGMWGACVENM